MSDEERRAMNKRLSNACSELISNDENVKELMKQAIDLSIMMVVGSALMGMTVPEYDENESDL